MIETDVCIVGAGIMGCAAAYYLSKTGDNRIVLVDQYSVGNDYCSSNDANRVFRYAYGRDEFYTRLAIESRKLWKEIEKETRTSLLIPSGLLLVEGENEEWNRFNEDTYKTFRMMRLETEELDRPGLLRRYPQFHAERAFLDPYGAVILASKALTTFSETAVKKGVQLLNNARAVEVSAGDIGRQRVRLADGQQVTADRVIVTAGPWSNSLIPDSIVKMTPTRQQILYFQPENVNTYRSGRFPVFFAEDFYGIPATGIDAVKVSHIGRNTPVRPETAKRSIDTEEVDACRHILHKYIPQLATGRLAASKVCLYDMTPDKDFAIGHHPENRGITYGYGFSGHGFKFAPLIGRTLARLSLGEDPGFDAERFNLARTAPIAHEG